MSRRGRKSKSAPRHPGGKIIQPTKDQRHARQKRNQEAMMETVLAQPHRRGSRDQRCENALGRLVLRLKLRPELYDAGEEYRAIVARYRAARGVPIGLRVVTPGPTREDQDAALARARTDNLRRRIILCEHDLKADGIQALLTVRTLVLDGFDIGMDQDPYAVRGLKALAVSFGMLHPSADPYLTTRRNRAA